MRKILLGTIVPVGLAIAFSGTAYAGGFDDVSGTLSGSYAYFADGSGMNLYGVNGALTFPITPVWTENNGIEVYGGYHAPTTGDVDMWNIGGAIYAGGKDGRIEASYTYHDLGVQSIHLHTFGLGGEWFASPSVSVDVRGGGASGEYTSHGVFHGGSINRSVSGGFIGGQAKWYVIPDVSVSAGFDCWSAGTNIPVETLQAEWLVSESTPVALYGGYQHFVSNGWGEDILFVGVKLFTNGAGAKTLVDRERTGSLGYITPSLAFFGEY